jgi:predicted Zn-dependent protease
MQRWLGLLLLTSLGIKNIDILGLPPHALPLSSPSPLPASSSQTPPSSLLSPASQSQVNLPPLKVHPLPPSLAKFHSSPSDDYFDQITASPLGYLIWSTFPIKVYVDQSPNPQDSAASNQRFLQWTQAVRQAIADWGLYLPIQEVLDPSQADIRIERQEPPLSRQLDPKTGQLQIPRARNAQTRYEFYDSGDIPSRLRQRMTIQIKPGLSQSGTLATARHEMGHALGLWGHSTQPDDTLYFSQTKESPPISIRDVNTLKKVYQQPTRLGWPLPQF